jgi:glycosyltransferase involved in cell wall biosynthesis
MAGATVRVHLLTYRRPALLPRALDSLCAQTFRDWVCEVHNDDPADPSPAELVASRGDSRVRVVTHAKNEGLVRSFNHLFTRAGEKYLSVLEDDNWWDPDFLETMTRLMDANPGVAAGWANLRFCHEQPDGTWLGEGKCIWEVDPAGPPRFYQWPGPGQVAGALSSQGAMLWRTEPGRDLRIPECVTPSCMEAVRERATPHPLLFCPRPLGNYAVTRETTRGRDAGRYRRERVLLAGTFFASVPLSPAAVRAALAAFRGRPYSGHTFLFAALATSGCRHLVRYAGAKDWWYALRSALRHPAETWRTLFPGPEHRELRAWLLRHTAERRREAAAQGFDGSLDGPRFETAWPTEPATPAPR